MHIWEGLSVRAVCVAEQWRCVTDKVISIEQAYLVTENRRQYVCINDSNSECLDVKCGVPQGSILGPALFILCVNDMCNVSKSLKSILFADDTNLFYAGKDLNEICELVSRELYILHMWFQVNKLSLNGAKTNFMIFCNKRYEENYMVSINGMNINRVSKVASHTYLGVKLDSKLSWAKHITEITTKSSKVLGMVKRTLGPCKPEVKDTAYNMLVRPKLEYASPIWNPHKSSQISRLERIQHYAARFVANDHRRTTSPTTLVLTLNWQTLERRRIIKQAMTFYKILNNIIKISPPSGLLTRSHNRHHYIVPRSRLNTVVYSFYPRAIRIWNTIPKEITEITQPESFQAAISKLPFTTPVHLKCL